MIHMMLIRRHSRSIIFLLHRTVWTAWTLLVFINPAQATTSVYHSPNDDGLSGSATVQPGGVRSVYLYIDGGPVASSPGSACHDGLGDEVCGYDLELTARNGLLLSSFSPDPHANLLTHFNTSSIKVNGLDTQSPGPGPHRIGELLVDTTNGGELELTGGEVVGANLHSELLSLSALATVPEPRGILPIGSGLCLLAGLARRRSRR